MTNLKLYLIPTTPSYENEKKDILRTSNIEIYITSKCITAI